MDLLYHKLYANVTALQNLLLINQTSIHFSLIHDASYFFLFQTMWAKCMRTLTKLRKNRTTVLIVLSLFNTALVFKVVGIGTSRSTRQTLSDQIAQEMNKFKEEMKLTTPAVTEEPERLLLRPKLGTILPNTLIVGAAYCGANALASFLSLHPNIAVTHGQLRFFTENYDKGLEWYSSMIKKPTRRQRIVLERSPDYFYSRDAPDRIEAVDPGMKIIIILRNPIKRLISDYSSAVLAKQSPKDAKTKTFEKAVIDPMSRYVNSDNKGVQNSIYFPFVYRWIDKFSKDQVYIVDGESFISNPIQELRGVEKFLGVSSNLKEDNLYFNSTSGYFCPKLRGGPRCYGHAEGWHQLKNVDFTVLERLKQFYEHHNERLYSLLGTRFDWT